jgi:hypothetical protein
LALELVDDVTKAKKELIEYLYQCTDNDILEWEVETRVTPQQNWQNIIKPLSYEQCLCAFVAHAAFYDFWLLYNTGVGRRDYVLIIVPSDRDAYDYGHTMQYWNSTGIQKCLCDLYQLVSMKASIEHTYNYGHPTAMMEPTVILKNVKHSMAREMLG